MAQRLGNRVVKKPPKYQKQQPQHAKPFRILVVAQLHQCVQQLLTPLRKRAQHQRHGLNGTNRHLRGLQRQRVYQRLTLFNGPLPRPPPPNEPRVQKFLQKVRPFSQFVAELREPAQLLKPLHKVRLHNHHPRVVAAVPRRLRDKRQQVAPRRPPPLQQRQLHPRLRNVGGNLRAKQQPFETGTVAALQTQPIPKPPAPLVYPPLLQLGQPNPAPPPVQNGLCNVARLPLGNRHRLCLPA